EDAITEQSMARLEVFDLADAALEPARSLSYGNQRKLEIARALATSPKLLLLDEPAAGMNPAEVVQLADLIQDLRQRFGVTILLIEHQMKMVMSICERSPAMDFGQVIAEGPPEGLRSNPRVLEAYLGRGVTLARAKRGPKPRQAPPPRLRGCRPQPENLSS